MEERRRADHRRTLRDSTYRTCEKYHVTYLEVFGSYVRDEQTPESNSDVLLTSGKVSLTCSSYMRA